MAIIAEVIRVDKNNTLSFGNYESVEKLKIDGFELNGDLYKVKTHNEITRLEKNGKLLLETVPGSTVYQLKVDSKSAVFSTEGFENTQFTVELEPQQEYKILVDDVNVGSMKSNLSGKINFSLELSNKSLAVQIEKI